MTAGTAGTRGGRAAAAGIDSEVAMTHHDRRRGGQKLQEPHSLPRSTPPHHRAAKLGVAQHFSSDLLCCAAGSGTAASEKTA